MLIITNTCYYNNKTGKQLFQYAIRCAKEAKQDAKNSDEKNVKLTKTNIVQFKQRTVESLEGVIAL